MPPEVSPLPLRDIHLPTPISWWPPAPGWWLLLGVLMLAAVLLYRWRQRLRRPPFKKQALQQVQQLVQSYPLHDDARRYWMEVSILLRRLAISRFPQREVAGLCGSAWIEFLDSILLQSQNTTALRFSGLIGESLLAAPYVKQWRANGADPATLEPLLLAFIQALPEEHRRTAWPLGGPLETIRRHILVRLPIRWRGP